MEGNNDILYVLVIYGCAVEQSIAFQTLIAPYAEAISNTFVYDNSSTLQMTKHKVAAYIHDTGNSGISKAYNDACQYAKNHGYKWLLLMDQDTSFPPKSLDFYKTAARSVYAEMVVPRHKVNDGRYMSPTPYRMKTSSLQTDAPTGLVEFSKCAPINSGIMLTVESFIKSGGYEDKVWLDFSDICFIEKYKRHYRTFYVMPEVTCQQDFSGMETDPVKVYKRFCIYLECARNTPKPTIGDKLAMLITTLRPTLSRTVRERTLKYVKAHWNIYIKCKERK